MAQKPNLLTQFAKNAAMIGMVLGSYMASFGQTKPAAKQPAKTPTHQQTSSPKIKAYMPGEIQNSTPLQYVPKKDTMRMGAIAGPAQQTDAVLVDEAKKMLNNPASQQNQKPPKPKRPSTPRNQSYAEFQKTRDPNDFWLFSYGYHTALGRPLYTPAGFYWEGITPGIGKPGTKSRQYTMLRGGYSLVNEGSFSVNASGSFQNPVVGTTTFSLSASQMFTQAYVDFGFRKGFGTPDSDIYAQVYALGGMAFTPGAPVNTAFNASNGRAAVGAHVFAGFRKNGLGFGLFASGEILQEIPLQTNLNIGQFIVPRSDVYGKGPHVNLKAGLALTF